MTLPHAHQFVRRWRRILIPWPSPHTDTDAARAIELALLGVAVGPLPIFIGGALSRWPWTAIIPVGTIMLFSYGLSLRFRVVRRLLEKHDAQNLSDLRKHLYDKPSS